MTVLADLLAQWRSGRLTMTELREHLQSSGETGIKLLAALDHAIAAGSIESLDNSVLQTELTALPAKPAPGAMSAKDHAEQARHFAKTTVLENANQTAQVTTSDKTVQLDASGTAMRADPAKTLVMPAPPLAPFSALQDAASQAKPTAPVSAHVNETLIRPSSETVVMGTAAANSASDDPDATLIASAGQMAQTMIRQRQASDATKQRPGPSDAPAMETLVREPADAKTQLIVAEETQRIAESEQPSLMFTTTAVEVLVPGMMIKDRFKLVEQIGSGGMGVVFSAIDRRKTEAQDPNPMVAVKVLDREFAQHTKAFISLQREARKAQDLAHPNVVTVFDFDREGDRVFMTMEFLRGRSIDSVLREVRGKGLPLQEAMHIVKGVAEGLAYAHRKGIVHSDLKPGNIFLTDENVPKILDFGIARAIPSRVSQEKIRDIFDAGSLGAYTAAYATEEMMQGGSPDTSDDVYALALIAYELLAGTHPYKRQSAQDAKTHKLKPTPIKGLSRREWRLLEASLTFDRITRPKDAGEFLKRLTGITPVQKGLIAATTVLAVATIFFSYLTYEEAGPSYPFSQLPPAMQQAFLDNMHQGDELWQFYVKDKNMIALQDAIEQYNKAYELHPRNRDAVRALRKVADAILDSTRNNVEQQRELAKAMAERSDYLAKYDPIRKLL